MKTYLDWSKYEDAGIGDAYADIPKTGGDYAKAIAVCINSGICEQDRKGVMCPSFRITDNPIFSPGGRVKLLKKTFNSDDVETALTDQQLQEVMELCVGCKGCKRECENEIDMAAIKVEYLAQRYINEGVPLRNRLFAHVPTLLSKYPVLKTLIKFRNQFKPFANLGESMLGVSAEVSLPVPATKPFKKLTVPMANLDDNLDSAKPAVVLFVDTFNRYFSPQVVDAAYKVLSEANYQVEVLESNDETPLCCGRTHLANGLIEQAREQAQRLFDTVMPHVEQGKMIVGLEPSCVLSLKDEHLMLGLGDKAKRVAKQSLLFEEFIAKEITAKRWALAFKPLAGQYQVHGHCHQKAVGAMKSMRRVLKLIPELQSKQIESSCCGMAGHFGLEKEHREQSQQMAEKGLYPALRDAPEATTIANGFSCQQQIINGQFKPAQHLAEILVSAL